MPVLGPLPLPAAPLSFGKPGESFSDLSSRLINLGYTVHPATAIEDGHEIPVLGIFSPIAVPPKCGVFVERGLVTLLDVPVEVFTDEFGHEFLLGFWKLFEVIHVVGPSEVLG